MLQPTLGIRSQRLLADDRASREEKPRHACAFALVHYLGANGRTPIRQHRAFAHRTPPHTAEPTSYLTPI